MSQKIANKTAKILVIEGSQALRGQLVDIIKSKGYEKPESSNNIGEAILRLGGNTYDWIITSLFATEPENAMQLLKLCTMIPTLRGTRVTFILEKTELFCIPLAYELGMKGWMAKQFTKETAATELGNYLKTFESLGWNPVLMAAQGLRAHLKSSNLPLSLINLEEGLFQAYPSQTQYLLNIADAQFLAKQPDQAIRTLYHLAIIDPTKAEQAKAIATNYGKGDSFNIESKAEAIKGLGLDSVLLVDPDATVQKSLTDFMQELGVSKITSIADGKEALAWLDANPKPSLILHEWRMPGVTGPGFIQKIRSSGKHDVHLIVMSSLIKPQDQAIIREMGVAGIFQKPYIKEDLVKALMNILHQDCLPTEPLTQERKIFALLAMGSINEAMPLRDALFSNSLVTGPRKDLVSAEFQYAEKHFEAARDLAVKALKGGAESLRSLNLLGKCMMQLKDFESAAKCFERAQEMSPSNIERLCALAEAQQELGQNDKATESAAMALTVDPDALAAKETVVKIAIASGDVKKAQQLIAGIDSLHNIVSYLNNRAISLSRSGKAKDSLDIYKNASQAIPPTRKDVAALISYNMSLAHIRAQDLKAAMAVLAEVIKGNDERVKTKAESLLKRLDAAVKANQPVVLRDGNEPVDKSAAAAKGAAAKKNPVMDAKTMAQNRAASSDALATMSIKKGEICCFKIFIVQEPVDKQALVLVKTLPKFQAGGTLKTAG